MPQFRVRLGAFHLFDADADDGGEVSNSSLGIRVDDSGVAPEGVGQLESFGMYGKVAWVFNEQTRVWFTVGAPLAGTIRLENDDGRTISGEDLDPAPFLGLRAEFRF
ncbi:MAG: hypothetical protein ACYTFF_20970 [Planctomycetota bacterium]|jgi:hypothetical protein